MNNITISKKEYEELLQLKEKLDQILMRTLIREKKPMTGSVLLNFVKLKIKGVPKDLSENTDFYLYGGE